MPVPFKAPITLENPPRSRVPLTVKAEAGLNAVVEPAISVPAG
jgi:hypothetical protein